ENIDEKILAVAGQRQRGDPIVTGAADLPHELLGVLDRIALRQGIAAKQHLAVMVEHHCFRGGAAEIAADDDAPPGMARRRARAAGESRGREMPVALAVLVQELPEFLLAADEPA